MSFADAYVAIISLEARERAIARYIGHAQTIMETISPEIDARRVVLPKIGKADEVLRSARALGRGGPVGDAIIVLSWIDELQ